MMQTVEAIIDDKGKIRLLKDIRLPAGSRALVTVFEEDEANSHPADLAILSEPALSEDWNRPEEDAAWAHLQSAR